MYYSALLAQVRRVVWSMPSYSAARAQREAADNEAVDDPTQPAPEHVPMMVTDDRREYAGLDTYLGD